MNGEATAKPHAILVVPDMEPRDKLSIRRQYLCTTLERELARRGCVDYTPRASQLLNSFNIKQSFTVKDYHRGVQAYPCLLSICLNP